MKALFIYIFLNIIYLSPSNVEASPALLRGTFGFEYITPGTSVEHNYKTTMMSLGTEFRINDSLNFIAAGSFGETGVTQGVESKYDLLFKYNKFAHKYLKAGLILGYTNSTIVYQTCALRMPDFCTTHKKEDLGAVYGASLDLTVSSNTVIIVSLLKGGHLDLTRLSILLSRPF